MLFALLDFWVFWGCFLVINILGLICNESDTMFSPKLFDLFWLFISIRSSGFLLGWVFRTTSLSSLPGGHLSMVDLISYWIFNFINKLSLHKLFQARITLQNISNLLIYKTGIKSVKWIFHSSLKVSLVLLFWLLIWFFLSLLYLPLQPLDLLTETLVQLF